MALLLKGYDRPNVGAGIVYLDGHEVTPVIKVPKIAGSFIPYKPTRITPTVNAGLQTLEHNITPIDNESNP